ncbi:Os05g0311037 [Oryza sativa Japonica Group]|uniref:Os05g0311037 protein n=1 Tax=Oryza sativa subsp. japonica TaxID=39947 RepID=A0A0P0WKK7_ORYSJ|nr:hypothetical protein EE612_028542 [Oryza sativa]BAS93287.1 Os05g0311037 [Oryza sativa Japonica Group]
MLSPPNPEPLPNPLPVMLMSPNAFSTTLGPDIAEYPPLSSAVQTFILSSSLAFFFITSLVSLILLCIISLCAFSSWLSISQYCLTCWTVTFSLFPRQMASSKANISSNAVLQTPSSSREGEYSGTS